MVTLHVRHYAFGIALPILMAAVAYLQTHATAAEIDTAQGQSAAILQYVSIGSTLVAGFLDMYKARNSSGTDPQPLLVAPPMQLATPTQTAPVQNITPTSAVASDPPVLAPINPQLSADEIKAISNAGSVFDVIKIVGVNDAQNGTQRWKDAWQLFQSLKGYRQAAASS